MTSVTEFKVCLSELVSIPRNSLATFKNERHFGRVAANGPPFKSHLESTDCDSRRHSELPANFSRALGN